MDNGLESVFRKQIKRLAVCAFDAVDEIHMAVPDVLDVLLRARIFLQAIDADLEVCRFRRCTYGKGCRRNHEFVHALSLSSLAVKESERDDVEYVGFVAAAERPAAAVEAKYHRMASGGERTVERDGHFPLGLSVAARHRRASV